MQLAALRDKPFLRRCWGYFHLTGPGWLQSALTLGSGSAIASLLAGATHQYSLLWVQPLAMVLGIIMLDVIAHQTLATGARPFRVMRTFLHPAVAWFWAFSALGVTLMWHFPQYALAAGMTEDIVEAMTGLRLTGTAQTLFLLGIGLIILLVSTWITWNYRKGHKGVRFYESTLKAMIWLIVAAFAVVVICRAWQGAIDWRQVAKGFVPLYLPQRRGLLLVVAAFAAVIGVNSTFLFPYTLLARGWRTEHRGLSRFDLVTGTFLPFCIITSLIIIAAGSTIYNPDGSDPTMITPLKAAGIFQSTGLGVVVSRLIFGVGIIGMALSTLTVHMLMSGFAACELLGAEPGGRVYRLACLFPAPAFTGVVLWKYMGPWIAVPASATCGLLLPFTYLIFIMLQNNKAYLGHARPEGMKRIVWNGLTILALLVSLGSAAFYVYAVLP